MITVRNVFRRRELRGLGKHEIKGRFVCSRKFEKIAKRCTLTVQGKKRTSEERRARIDVYR